MTLMIARTRCKRCALLSAHCVCAQVPALTNRTPVRILQHPDESRHSLNTARWVALGLSDARIHAGTQFDASQWRVTGHTPLLLYPADPSHAPAPLPPPPYVLVALDGTWRQAAALLRTHPGLAALARLPITGAAHSQYRLRKSPRADGLSTVEAVVAALDRLDAPQNHSALLAPFHAHIDQQIARQRSHMTPETFARNYPDLVDGAQHAPSAERP